MQMLEGAHVSSLRQVTRKQEMWRRYVSWQQVTEESVLQGAGTRSFRKYVDRQQTAVAEWVALQTIFDVCVRDMGYEGGWRLWVPWCR